ncbi:HNH endonuclease signature motif containing protein [Escherichia coli]|uniref:HNH endonuclease signature motif containing protein n=1 Tax=Escherichia coli TaxID=562 RepID=UPI000B00898E
MNWNEVFVLKDDGLLYWSDQYLSRPKMFNISKEKPAGHIFKDKNRKTSYIIIRYQDKIYAAHRIIWEMFYGEIPSGMQIDHKDGNGLNNSIDNLRLVSLGENLKTNLNTQTIHLGVLGFHGIRPIKSGWHILATQGSALISDTLRVSMMQLL